MYPVPPRVASFSTMTVVRDKVPLISSVPFSTSVVPEYEASSRISFPVLLSLIPPVPLMLPENATWFCAATLRVLPLRLIEVSTVRLASVEVIQL